MQFFLLSIILFSFYFSQDVIAQLEIPSDLIIYFNVTDVDYPKDILFWLYTRETGDNYETIRVNDKKLLEQSSYNTSRATKFITHGWTSSGIDDSCKLPREGFLQHDDYNVIVVDWSKFSMNTYIVAAPYVKVVGIYVSKMIKFLVSQGSDIKKMSLVGHSLGAHVMGSAGYELSPKVAHIVGLDPARPGFEFILSNSSLHYTNADHVEIIHTNAFMLGYSISLGHTDYWPNGGIKQPGCGKDLAGSCAHARSYMYYAESLTNPDSWYAVLCSSYFQFEMGLCKDNPIERFPRWDYTEEIPKGNYMLRTRDKPLFGMGRRGTRPKIRDFS